MQIIDQKGRKKYRDLPCLEIDFDIEWQHNCQENILNIFLEQILVCLDGVMRTFGALHLHTSINSVTMIRVIQEVYRKHTYVSFVPGITRTCRVGFLCFFVPKPPRLSSANLLLILMSRFNISSRKQGLKLVIPDDRTNSRYHGIYAHSSIKFRKTDIALLGILSPLSDTILTM